MNTKQVIVMRKDLNMRKGKIAAQSAHASLGVFTRRMQELPITGIWMKLARVCLKLSGVHNIKRLYNCDFTDEMLAWLDSSYTKIGVGCDSEDDLYRLQQMAIDYNLPHCLIRDNGQTEFKDVCSLCKGSGKINDPVLCGNGDITIREEQCTLCSGSGKVNRPTFTCIAIGPDRVEKVDLLTKIYSLI